ncbi:hypothetical protein [Chryseobacterium indoltheticum]|uniref:hypothetical protein n=1 Tax=Chryseobacterium indoltheticum TaxID=254 RepID=UPI003F49A370
MLTIECHEEQIPLCVTIQNFGYLFVFDSYSCIAASENVESLPQFNSKTIIGRSLEDILIHFAHYYNLTVRPLKKKYPTLFLQIGGTNLSKR